MITLFEQGLQPGPSLTIIIHWVLAIGYTFPTRYTVYPSGEIPVHGPRWSAAWPDPWIWRAKES